MAHDDIRALNLPISDASCAGHLPSELEGKWVFKPIEKVNRLRESLGMDTSKTPPDLLHELFSPQ